jgi:uncharacterized protein YbjT (DUF2867 family)
MTVKRRLPTVCLFGGTGFVGRTLVNHLVRRGYGVRIPTRSRQRNRDLLVFPGVELIVADVHEEDTLLQLVSGSEVVINLIGILNERGHDGSGFKRVHVDFTAKLLRACQQAGVRRLLHMSALKANAERGPSHYLRSKGQAEQLIKKQSDLRYTIFKPSVIFGEGDSFVNRFAGLLQLMPVLPLPGADARMSPVFVDDIARAFVVALEDSTTVGRSYELCGPDIYSLAEIVQFVRRRLGLRRAVVAVPKPLERLQAWIGDYLLPGKPFSLDNLRSLSVAGVCSENGFASLGIEPRSMADIVPGYLRGRAEG